MTTLRVVKVSVAEKKFNPDQPRVPAGDPQGGQWAAEGGAGSESAPVGHPQGKVTVKVKDFAQGYEDNELQRFGMTKDHIKRMLSLPGYDTSITIGRNRDYNTLSIETKWTDPATKERIGHSKREFMFDRDVAFCLDDELVFAQKFQNRGLAQDLYKRQIEILTKETTVDQIRLQADISIGRYAWAKQGFQYSDNNDARQASGKFLSWARRNGINQPPGGWPRFRTPQDVANYRIPGVKLPHTAIENPDIKPGDYEAGKAFMLDKSGHGSWRGKLWLRNKS